MIMPSLGEGMPAYSGNSCGWADALVVDCLAEWQVAHIHSVEQL